MSDTTQHRSHMLGALVKLPCAGVDAAAGLALRPCTILYGVRGSNRKAELELDQRACSAPTRADQRELDPPQNPRMPKKLGRAGVRMGRRLDTRASVRSGVRTSVSLYYFFFSEND